MDAIQETVRLLLLDERGRMLFVRKTTTQQWHWPGGKRKSRESLARALRREVREETGLSLSNLKRIHVETLPSEIIYCYVGTVKNYRCKKPDGKEIDRICWRSLSGAKKIPLTETQKRLLQNVAIIAQFL